MSLFRLIFLVFALVGIARSAEQPLNVAAAFQTEDNLKTVAEPERVDVCLLRKKKTFFSRKPTGEYKEGRYITLSSETAALLSRTLRDEKTYDWESLSMCTVVYNARVRFHRNGHFVYADFCFGCDVVALGKDGSSFAAGDFTEASSSIFEVVRATFPDDRLVHTIADRRTSQEKARREAEEWHAANKKKSPPSVPEVQPSSK